jgi:hypothetical protein
LADLGNAKLVRRQESVVDIAACCAETLLQSQPRPPAIVPGQIGHILEDDVARTVMIEDGKDAVEEVAPLGTREALLLTGLREWLARGAGTQDVVRRNVRGRNAPDVASCVQPKVLLVQLPQRLIDIPREDARMSKALQGDVEATESGK